MKKVQVQLFGAFSELDPSREISVLMDGEQVTDAIAKAYEAVAQIHWTGVQYRHDIAKRAVNRK